MCSSDLASGTIGTKQASVLSASNVALSRPVSPARRRGFAVGRGWPLEDAAGGAQGDEADEGVFEFMFASLQEAERRQFVFDQVEDV